MHSEIQLQSYAALFCVTLALFPHDSSFLTKCGTSWTDLKRGFEQSIKSFWSWLKKFEVKSFFAFTVISMYNVTKTAHTQRFVALNIIRVALTLLF